MAVLTFGVEFPKEIHYIQKKTYFQEKILSTIYNHSGKMPVNLATNPSLIESMVGAVKPKVHAIIPKGSKIKKGTILHMNSKGDRKTERKFAPIMKCTDVEEIKIVHNDFGNTAKRVDVFINGKRFGEIRSLGGVLVSVDKSLRDLLTNEGYDNALVFVNCFPESNEYDLVHWGNVRYDQKEKK
jgi:hypothetical protein